MRLNKILQSVLFLLLIPYPAFSQDMRTLDTKVADLLARFAEALPADAEFTP